MKNKNILAITLAVTMGFANAGIFDDIGNGIAGINHTLSLIIFLNPIIC
jgi:hypothetical protein